MWLHMSLHASVRMFTCTQSGSKGGRSAILGQPGLQNKTGKNSQANKNMEEEIRVQSD